LRLVFQCANTAETGFRRHYQTLGRQPSSASETFMASWISDRRLLDLSDLTVGSFPIAALNFFRPR
jgi:hypothetical protein